MGVSGLCTRVPGTARVWSAVADTPQSTQVSDTRYHKRAYTCLTRSTKDAARAAHAQVQPQVTPTWFHSLTHSLECRSLCFTCHSATRHDRAHKPRMCALTFVCQPFCETQAVELPCRMLNAPAPLVRSWWRHEQRSIAAVMETLKHHSAGRSAPVLVHAYAQTTTFTDPETVLPTSWNLQRQLPFMQHLLQRPNM